MPSLSSLALPSLSSLALPSLSPRSPLSLFLFHPPRSPLTLPTRSPHTPQFDFFPNRLGADNLLACRLSGLGFHLSKYARNMLASTRTLIPRALPKAFFRVPRAIAHAMTSPWCTCTAVTPARDQTDDLISPNMCAIVVLTASGSILLTWQARGATIQDCALMAIPSL